MIYSDKLIQATEDYVNGGEWEAFHTILESDFYHSSCEGRCKPCSREHATRQLVIMRRHMEGIKDYNGLQHTKPKEDAMTSQDAI